MLVESCVPGPIEIINNASLIKHPNSSEDLPAVHEGYALITT